MKKLAALILGLSLILVACGGGQEAAAPEGEDNKIVIGVSPVPHAEIMDYLAPKFEEAGLEVETVIFDDYVQPNEQLASGDLDANYFQHTPYFEDYIAKNDLDLVSLGNVHIEPIGVYSDSIDALEDLKDGDEVIIPNDATNGGRALILLSQAGVISLEDPTDLASTEKDIVDNPKNLKFIPMEAQNIPNTYKDATLAVINSNYALGAGLNPSEDAIISEEADSPYANLVAVRAGEEDQEKFKILMEVLQSEDTAAFLEEKYKGAILPSFE
ncbi:MAG: MetQ/NlpA family ABC transporter substrate-binding protein [Tissierellia bacterium]|nr:MetQ/NlpA family ABC transporter substrate-binding protein [Tissierellia bacterium]